MLVRRINNHSTMEPPYKRGLGYGNIYPPPSTTTHHPPPLYSTGGLVHSLQQLLCGIVCINKRGVTQESTSALVLQGIFTPTFMAMRVERRIITLRTQAHRQSRLFFIYQNRTHKGLNRMPTLTGQHKTCAVVVTPPTPPFFC